MDATADHDGAPRAGPERRNNVLGVPAIDGVAGKQRVVAQVLLPTQAIAAYAAGMGAPYALRSIACWLRCGCPLPAPTWKLGRDGFWGAGLIRARG